MPNFSTWELIWAHMLQRERGHVTWCHLCNSNTTHRANRNVYKCGYISRAIWFLRKCRRADEKKERKKEDHKAQLFKLMKLRVLYLKSSFPKRDKRQIEKKWVRHAILLCTEPIHCSINVSCQIAIFPCLKCTARCSSFPNRYKRQTCF